jgi:hypothetical protein
VALQGIGHKQGHQPRSYLTSQEPYLKASTPEIQLTMYSISASSYG